MFLVTRQIFFYWWLANQVSIFIKVIALGLFIHHFMDIFCHAHIKLIFLYVSVYWVDILYVSVYRYLTGQVLYLWSEVLPPMFLSVKSSIYVPHNNGIFARCLRVIIKNIFKKCTNCHSFASNSNLGTPLLSYICFTQIETVF